jgi:membrane-associated protease RseP (regulator of RpoE activity)
MSGKSASNAWVRRAAEMPALEEFHLYHAAIDEGGLATLAEHANLKAVGLYYMRVGDGVLEPLVKLPLLSHLKLYGTQVTPAGLDKFKIATGLVVDYRRGAFLGVQWKEGKPDCSISDVTQGGPAEKGGLRPEDIVVRFGGEEVTNFPSLRELIAKRDVGEEVEVEVNRGTFENLDNQVIRRVILKITLAPWNLEQAVANPRQ